MAEMSKVMSPKPIKKPKIKPYKPKLEATDYKQLALKYPKPAKTRDLNLKLQQNRKEFI